MEKTAIILGATVAGGAALWYLNKNQNIDPAPGPDEFRFISGNVRHYDDFPGYLSYFLNLIDADETYITFDAAEETNYSSIIGAYHERLNELLQNPSLYKLYDGISEQSMKYELLPYANIDIYPIDNYNNGELKYITLDQGGNVWTVHSNAMICDFTHVVALLVDAYIRDDERNPDKFEGALRHSIQCFYINQYMLDSPLLNKGNWTDFTGVENIEAVMGTFITDDQIEYLNGFSTDLASYMLRRNQENLANMLEFANLLEDGLNYNTHWRGSSHAYTPEGGPMDKEFYDRTNFTVEPPPKEEVLGAPEEMWMYAAGDVVDAHEMIETFVNELDLQKMHEEDELEVIDYDYDSDSDL